MIAIRKSHERGHAQHGWLDSHHTFSFADYYNPKQMGFGPLRVINEDRVSPGRGFGTHGHADMEILTYVLSGALAHKDSMGHVETLHANDLQRISAGTGIMHSEYNGSATEPVHFLQIWIEPDTRGLTPSYQQLSLSDDSKRGKLQLVASPEGEGGLRIHQDARVLIGSVGAGESVNYGLEPGRSAWVHVIEGSASVNGQAVSTGDAAAVTKETSLAIQGIAAHTELLLFDLAGPVMQAK